MKHPQDITGQVFGRLTATHRDEVRREYWWFRCTCGTEKAIRIYSVLTQVTNSCGCLRREIVAKKRVTHGGTVGRRWQAEYHAWHGAKSRCYNENNAKFNSYGGRGIKVCDRWLGKDGYSNFLADMGQKPSPQHSLDRENNDGDYSPENCRWATPVQQANNKQRPRTFPTVRMDPALRAELKMAADAAGMTVGELVNFAARRAVEAHRVSAKYGARP